MSEVDVHDCILYGIHYVAEDLCVLKVRIRKLVRFSNETKEREIYTGDIDMGAECGKGNCGNCGKLTRCVGEMCVDFFFATFV